MSDTKREPEATKPRPDSDKKQPETVLLTAEELKAIASGATPGKPPISPSTGTPTIG